MKDTQGDAALMTWRSFLHPRSVWIRSACHCQLVNVLCRGNNPPDLKLVVDSGSEAFRCWGSLLLFWHPAMKGHVSIKALCPGPISISFNICGMWLIFLWANEGHVKYHHMLTKHFWINIDWQIWQNINQKKCGCVGDRGVCVCMCVF